MVDPVKMFSYTFTMQNLVAVSHTVRAHVGGSKNYKTYVVGALPLRMRAWLILERSPSAWLVCYHAIFGRFGLK